MGDFFAEKGGAFRLFTQQNDFSGFSCLIAQIFACLLGKWLGVSLVLGVVLYLAAGLSCDLYLLARLVGQLAWRLQADVNTRADGRCALSWSTRPGFTSVSAASCAFVDSQFIEWENTRRAMRLNRGKFRINHAATHKNHALFGNSTKQNPKFRARIAKIALYSQSLYLFPNRFKFQALWLNKRSWQTAVAVIQETTANKSLSVCLYRFFAEVICCSVFATARADWYAQRLWANYSNPGREWRWIGEVV